MHNTRNLVYPFSAIVDQETMKKALLLNTVNPKIGGVLIRGEKGTAKSLAVRALAELLPEIETISDCPFHCDPLSKEQQCEKCMINTENNNLQMMHMKIPLVELPVGATEDRITGTLDIETAIQTGEKRFDPGLLAAANRGILYIDEVNLLDDHLVDILLDAAAMGVNFVEREGISFSHPSNFILVGTMNPEEGELRPQLLDRFGLAVEVTGLQDPENRVEVIRRRFSFENDPFTFVTRWENAQEEIRMQVVRARQSVKEIEPDDEMMKLISRICLDFAVDGHRSDIVMYKTAVANAAWHGRTKVNEDDVREAAALALVHRKRRQPFEDTRFNSQQLEDSIHRFKDYRDPESRDEAVEASNAEDESGNNSNITRGSPDKGIVCDAEKPYSVKAITTPLLDHLHRNQKGKRSMSRTSNKSGRYTGSEIPKSRVTDLAVDATIRAASIHQYHRKSGQPEVRRLIVKRHDLRQKVRESKVGNLIMFILDGSGSMIAEERMVATKGAILSMLLDAYQRRDQVGLIIFRDCDAQLVLPPTNSIDLAQKSLRKLPAGGRTPLTHGLRLGLNTINDYLARSSKAIPLLVLISDGKGNVRFNGDDPFEEALAACREIKAARIHCLGIDTEEKEKICGRMEQLCTEMGGLYLMPEELKAERMAATIRNQIRYWR